MDVLAALSRRWFFWFFVASGFCGLVYQVVWLRLAMAQFGVTTPMVSIVLSVFMGGLALGSALAGWAVKRLAGRSAVTFLVLYGAIELVIASSVAVVPKGLLAGGAWLTGLGSASWGSLGHYALAGGFVALLLLPFTASMGATYPFAMAALTRLVGGDERAFSHLYLANVVGATLGTLGSAFVLIELLGFKGTLAVAAAVNGSLAVAAIGLGGAIALFGAARRPEAPAEEAATRASSGPWPVALLAMLFTTGLVTMGLEVVWTRQFTPYIGTEVYAFASILALYLIATFVGSAAYRTWSRLRPDAAVSLPAMWMAGATLALLALVGADPRWQLHGLVSVFLGVVPFSALMGFLTPMLVDRCARGDGGRAGAAYAVNVVGCILGPLLAGFWLLPAIGERWSLVAFAAMLAVMAVGHAARQARAGWRPVAALAAVSAVIVGATRDFETLFTQPALRRDYTATVIGLGTDVKSKSLLVNGIGMTGLSPQTKMMAHLPLAYRQTPAEKGLVICFGAGTAYRSMLSWGIDATVVELVPSVPELFGFFHADGEALKRAPRGRIVIDDGRRFLHTSTEQFDVITMDPPPPVPAAGTSMLYSREFYRLVKARLRPGGVFQAWLPYGDDATQASVTKALEEAFPHIKTFTSIEGWGNHYICSLTPLPERTASELASKLPAPAAQDLLEWGPMKTAEAQFARVLAQPVDYRKLSALSRTAPPLEDDRPINEYYFIRSKLARLMMR